MIFEASAAAPTNRVCKGTRCGKGGVGLKRLELRAEFHVGYRFDTHGAGFSLTTMRESLVATCVPLASKICMRDTKKIIRPDRPVLW